MLQCSMVRANVPKQKRLLSGIAIHINIIIMIIMSLIVIIKRTYA